MEEYNPPYTITQNMINSVADIMEKIGKISVIEENRIQLLKRNRIKSIQSSLAIEANSLSLSQVEDVINGKLVLGDKKEILEVKNALSAYDLFDKMNPFSINDLKRVHYEMTKGLCVNCGEFRNHAEGVFSGDTPIHIAPPPQMVSPLMENLFRYLSNSKDNMIIKSCVFHYEFEFIHPFSDGNGRMGRYWQSLLLASYKPIFKYLPIETILKNSQAEYYNAFRVSNSEGNSNKFIEFMLDCILATLNGENFNGNKYISPQVEKLMEVISDYPLSARELMQRIGLKSLISFRENYLNPALKAGLIKMTIPTSPRNKNQRYYK